MWEIDLIRDSLDLELNKYQYVYISELDLKLSWNPQKST